MASCEVLLDVGVETAEFGGGERVEATSWNVGVRFERDLVVEGGSLW